MGKVLGKGKFGQVFIARYFSLLFKTSRDRICGGDKEDREGKSVVIQDGGSVFKVNKVAQCS